MSDRKVPVVVLLGLLGFLTLVFWIRRGDQTKQEFIQLDGRYWKCTDWQMKPIGMAVKRECIQWTFKP